MAVGSNPKDMEFFRQASKRKWKNAKIAAFSMTRRKGRTVEKDELMRQILEAETPVVTIVGKTWLLHVSEVLRAKPEENLAMIGDTIRFLRNHGKCVIYDAEHSFDGFKDEADYALATWQAAEKAGAECVVLCDTNGGCLPGEIARITAFAGKLNVRVGIHTHDDCGLPCQRHRGAGRRRHSHSRNNQWVRRTHGQLQPDECHSARSLQIEKAWSPGEIPAQTEGPFRLRR